MTELLRLMEVSTLLSLPLLSAVIRMYSCRRANIAIKIIVSSRAVKWFQDKGSV